jgi:hypothetical protein
MAFEISYFHARVLAEIESWPVGVVADYARLIELLMEHGANLRLPHSRAFGDGLFELSTRGVRASVGRSTAFSSASGWWCCTPLSRSRSKRPTAI